MNKSKGNQIIINYRSYKKDLPSKKNLSLSDGKLQKIYVNSIINEQNRFMSRHEYDAGTIDIFLLYDYDFRSADFKKSKFINHIIT